MDPLSIAASVAGLLGVTIQLVEMGTKYGKSSPKAQSDDFIFELEALIDVLRRLKKFLESPDAPPAFNEVSVFLSANKRCKSKIQELLQKLQRTVQETNKIKKAVDRLMWPLTEKEHQGAVEDIHRYTQIFNFALTAEGCSLLAKSSAETGFALKQQAQKMEETKKLCGAIPDLVTQIDASLDQISTIRSLIQDLPGFSKELASISQGVSDLKIVAEKLESRYGEEERERMMSWLSPVSFEAKQRQLFDRHQRGTGEWLMQHEIFKIWKATKGSTLWCSGIPGAGKTMMASFVINALREVNKVANVPVAFIYADYKEHRHQSSVNLLSAITRQLAMQVPTFMETAFSRYRERIAQSQDDQVPRLDFAEHLELLQDGSKHVDRCFIVIDAIDELPGTEETADTDVRYELLHSLTKLEYVSMFCTSRPHVDGSLYFPNFSELPIEAKDQDLRTFLEETMSSSRRLKSFFSKDVSLREEIVTTITQKASGMFLMARLQADEVKTALSVRQVRVVLGKLSGKLADMYKKTLDRINNQPYVEAKLGLRAISWVANVKRPLTVSEFVHALSLEPDDEVLDGSSLIDMTIILETCGGLLQLQPALLESNVANGPFISEETVGFVHYTMHEYMNSSTDHTTNNGDIANASLTYLCLQDFRDKGPRHHSGARDFYPFLAYAAPFWPAHAEVAGDSLRMDLVEMLISPSLPNLGKNWLRFTLQEHFGPLSFNVPLGFAATAVAVQGASTILQRMLDLGLVVNVRHLEKLTPFGVALTLAPRGCLDLLFRGGLSDDAESNRTWTSAALQDCHTSNAMDLFLSLLEQHIDVIKTSDHASIDFPTNGSMAFRYDPPLLSKALLLREIEVVKNLLSAGWDLNVLYPSEHVNGVPANYGTVLHDAILSNSVELVRLLVKAGSNVSGPWPDRSPLMLAVCRDNEAVVQILLDAGASIHDKDRARKTPLSEAIEFGLPTILRMLLKYSGNVDFSELDVQDPMDIALVYGDDPDIGLLAPYYFPPDLSKPYFARRLYRLMNSGRCLIVQDMLEARRVTTDEMWFKNALELNTNVTALKASPDADVYATMFGKPQLPHDLLIMLRDCIQEAIQWHESMADDCSVDDSLIDTSTIDFPETDNSMIHTLSPLEPIIQCGNLSLLQQLVTAGLDFTQGPTPAGPLMAAFRHRSIPIIDYLLSNGANVKSCTGRLALECYLLFEGLFFLSDIAVATVNLLGSYTLINNSMLHLTKPWLTCEALLYMCRRADDEGRLIIETALEQGVMPCDATWLDDIARWGETIWIGGPFPNGDLKARAEEALERNGLDYEAKIVELADIASFGGASYIDKPDQAEERDAVEKFLEDIRAIR